MDKQSDHGFGDEHIDLLKQEKSTPKNSTGMNALVHISPLLGSLIIGMTSTFAESGYVGFGTSFLPMLAPLALWFALKEKHPSVEKHAKKALNFQITLFLFGVIMAVVAVVVILVAVLLGVATNAPEAIMALAVPLICVLVPVGLVLAVLSFIMPIVKAVQANGGSHATDYPFARQFFSTYTSTTDDDAWMRN